MSRSVPSTTSKEDYTEYRSIDMLGVYTTTREDNQTHEKTTGYGWFEKEATKDLHDKLHER